MKKVILTATESNIRDDGSYSKQDRHTILTLLQEFASRPVRNFVKFEKYGLYFEHHSIESMIKNYIRWYNNNVREYGDGYATDWDPDDHMVILYKNGKIREIWPEVDEGNKLVPIDNIDSIILDGSWGTAFAGKHIGFRDETVYDDILDIRADFTL